VVRNNDAWVPHVSNLERGASMGRDNEDAEEETMKLLVTGDWHPDVVTLGIPRFDEVATAAYATVQAAIDEDVDVYCFLGDLADPDSGASTFRALELAMNVAMRLVQHGKHSIWISGNHDVFEDGSNTTTITPMRSLQREGGYVHVAETPRVVTIEDVRFMCLPFTSATREAKDTETIASSLWPKEGRVVVLGHMTHIRGVGIGSETTDMPRGRAVPFPMVATVQAVARFNGHFHARQVSPDGIIMPGTLARLRFDEERHNPGYVLAEV
jgi:DNA repair exonuclease SbcCD nuclease subunit